MIVYENMVITIDARTLADVFREDRKISLTKWPVGNHTKSGVQSMLIWAEMRKVQEIVVLKNGTPAPDFKLCKEIGD